MREWIKNIDDNDLYVIKRAFIDSSFDTTYSTSYDNEHKKEHSEITTAILKECKTRDSKRLKCDSLIRKAIEKLSEYEKIDTVEELKTLKAENEALKKQLENTKSRIYISYEKGLYGDTDYAILFYVSPNKTFYVLEEFTEEKYGKKVKEVAEARLRELEAQ